jgi:lysophospholipase L1-like esterase
VPAIDEQDRWMGAAPVSHHHRFTRPALFVVVLAAVAAIVAVVGGRQFGSSPEPLWPAEAAQTGASTCTDPVAAQQWRVSWKVSQQLGVLPTALQSRTLPGGAWQDRSGENWQLRWNQAPAENAGTDFAVDHTVTAPLSGLSQVAVSASLSPRFVTPDGACSVYTAPFGPGAAGPGSVAVIGDSLVAQVVPAAATPPVAASSSPDSSAPSVPNSSPGPLRRALSDEGYRSQIDGQGGRRWVVPQEKTDALDLANGAMVDELRGLRSAGTVVVSLGTNDANYVSLAPNETDLESRLNWTLTGLEQTLDELAKNGHCTVLVTMAARGKGSPGIENARQFELAAARINDLMRRKAEAEPRLALYDWGTQGDQHPYGTAQAWFGPDTVHLSAVGLPVYVRALTEAAALGCS